MMANVYYLFFHLFACSDMVGVASSWQCKTIVVLFLIAKSYTDFELQKYVSLLKKRYQKAEDATHPPTTEKYGLLRWLPPSKNGLGWSSQSSNF